MKCTFCGNNVPDGSEICPECGMILSLDGVNDADITVPAFTPNVFGSEPIKTPEMPEGYEESAFSSEISAPEYKAESIPAENKAEEAVCDTAADTPVAEDALVEAEPSYEAPSYEPASFEDEPAEVYEAPAYDDGDAEASFSVQDEVAEESDYESFADAQSTEEEEVFVPYAEGEDEQITPVIVPVEDAAPEEPVASETNDSASENEDIEEADDDDDTYISSGKKGRAGTIAALSLLLVILVVAGGYIVKKVIPVDSAPTTKPDDSIVETSDIVTTEPSLPDDTTEVEDTTEPSVTEGTTEADTTAADVTEPTTEPTTEATTEPSTETTTKPTTTKPSTTKPSTTKPSTTKPSTTKPSTTKPSTTKPSTTKPSTTKPTTTKPSTTVDPYGINGEAELKKPSSYLSESYIGYTSQKVDMLGAPSSSADWVQSLGRGAEVKVLAKQNGYSYVYSTRFGTYGWVKSSAVSDSRPVEGTTATTSGTVKPDKNGSGEIMYTVYSVNLRMGPGTNYDAIKIVPINYQVKIIGYKSGVSGWAYVTDLVSGKNGWVSTEYLKAAE